MKKIFITLLTFNDNPATWNCLKSLESQKKNNFSLFVVVVDNASVEKFYPKDNYKNFELIVLRNEKNLGFSGGQNTGIKFALENGADFITILNNDTIADPNLIEELLGAIKDNVGIAVPKIYFAKGHEYHKEKYKKDDLGKVIWYAGAVMDWDNIIGTHRGVDEVDHDQYQIQEETEVATGCCMMVRKEVFENVGLFDERFFLYYEDGDLSMRVKSAGYKIIYTPRAFLWHLNAKATGGSGSSLQDYYISRNRMLFGFGYASVKTKLALFKESLKILTNGRHWQKIGIKDYYLKRFGKGTYKINE